METAIANTKPDSSQKTNGFLNPALIVQELDLKPGETVADFGAGAGHFTFKNTL